MIKEYKGTGYFCTPYGEVWRKKSHGWVKINPQENSKYGHKQVEIYNGSGSKKRVYLHRFVYETWIGDIKDGYEIDHIDFNPRNNNLLNLRALPIKENRGRKKNPVSRLNSISKCLTIEQVKYIKSLGKFNKVKLAKELGVSRSAIYYALKGSY